MLRYSVMITLAAAFAASTSCFTFAGDSPGFRGPYGNGISPEKEAPIHWGPENNIKWKVPLPAPGNSSPIVTGDRVLLTCGEDREGRKRSLYCFDRKNGKQLWVKTVDFGRKTPTHQTNPYCASSPASDGKVVVAWHGSAGLFCYDLSGKELWRRDLGEFRHEWGYASSPVIYRDRIILNCGPGKRTFLTAIELATGETLWETPESLAGNGSKRDDDGYIGTWSTPLIAKVDGREQIICSMPTRVVAYNPADGKVISWCQGLRSKRGDLAYSSPMISAELGLCLAIGGYGGPSVGFRLGGQGDVTESRRLWRIEKNPQSIGTGVFLGDHVFRTNAGKPAVQCIEAKTGRVVWSAPKKLAGCWGSIIAAGGHLYVTNKRGTTYVFKPDPKKFELVAENHLAEPSNSTPAFSNGQIFLRTFEHLYCIEE